MMKLKTDPDYYCDTIKVKGVTIKYREIDKTDLEAFFEKYNALLAPAETPAGPEAMPSAESLTKMLTINLDFADWILERGVVAWDLKGHETAPGDAVHMSNADKLAVCKMIIRDTLMNSEELDFTGASPRQ